MDTEHCSKEISVGAQTVCFSRFDHSFYRSTLNALVDFLRPSARRVKLHLYIFLHNVHLDEQFCLDLAKESPFPVTFRAIHYVFKNSREDPELYAFDVNHIYAEMLACNTMPYVFHIDGDVMPQSPQFEPTLGSSWLEEWAAIIDAPGSQYAAICNIGSRYFEPGEAIWSFYRPYQYACAKYALRFSTQSFFCRRDLVAVNSHIDVALERHVSAKLFAMDQRSLNLHRQGAFAWQHHYYGTS